MQSCDGRGEHIEIMWEKGECPLCRAIRALERALETLDGLINKECEEKAS